MADRLQDAALQHVCVQHIDEVGVAPAEPVIFGGQHEQRLGRIETWFDFDGLVRTFPLKCTSVAAVPVMRPSRPERT